MGIVNIDVLVAGVEGVAVAAYDQDGVFVTQGVTGVSGQTSLSLLADPGGTAYNLFLSKTGWSFPPESRKPVIVSDPPDPDPLEFTGQEGTDGELVVLIVQDDQVVPQPVDGLLVRVYDQAGNFLASGMTGSYRPGEVAFTLVGAPDPGVEYVVHLFKDGVSVPLGLVQTIVVLQDDGVPMGGGGFGDGGFGGSGGLYPLNTFDFLAHVPAVPESTHPNMCLLAGTLYDASLRPLKDAIIEFKITPMFPDFVVSGSHFPHDPSVVAQHVIASSVKGKTDHNGFMSIELIRGSYYHIYIYGHGHPETYVESIIVPDRPGARLEDVLFPYVVSVTPEDTALDLQVGQTVTTSLEVVASNFQTIVGTADLSPLLLFSAEDPAIATVVLDATGKLSILGAAVGTTTLTVQRAANTFAPRLPSVPDIVLPTTTITVTA